MGASGKRHVVVVGGGLAGVTAAITAALEDAQVQVTLLDKNPRLGGNSAKASSGMNALNPEAGDTAALFERDTTQSGGGLSGADLVHTLVADSRDAVAFLQGLGVDLSQITQLGGHSKPRSHYNRVGPNVGLHIMQSVIKKAQELPNIRIVEGAQVKALQADRAGRVNGLTYTAAAGAPTPGAEQPAPQDVVLAGVDAVVLATGGFAASKQLLQAYNPEAAALATTNGPWATGDAVAWAQAVGARLIHMEQVQVHPTGFVDPQDPGAGTKWLAPEKFRGLGALLLNTAGTRFVNELATRDVVSNALLGQPGRRAFLVLPNASADRFGVGALKFYASKGMVAQVAGVDALAERVGRDAGALREELVEYNEGAASGSDRFGKTVFPALLNPDEPMWVAVVTPVVHYTMGGLEINTRAQVLSERDGRPIPGLFAAGEVSGGVHGHNRLGGNSLLECVVYGRIAGRHAAGRSP